jgi:hypothetical protein
MVANKPVKRAAFGGVKNKGGVNVVVPAIKSHFGKVS